MKCEKSDVCALLAIYYGRVETQEAQDGFVQFPQKKIDAAVSESKRRKKMKRDDKSRAK